MKKIMLAGLCIGLLATSGCASGITGVTPVNNQSQKVMEIISSEEAKEIAIGNAGVGVSDISEMKVSLDNKDGRDYYDISFYANDYKYSYEIDGLTGSILSGESSMNREAKPEATEPKEPDAVGSATSEPVLQKQPTNNTSNSQTISEAEIKQMVLERIPGATESNFVKFQIDYDDGHMEYEGEVVYNNMEYEFEIDAYSGAFRDWSVESVWD